MNNLTDNQLKSLMFDPRSDKFKLLSAFKSQTKYPKFKKSIKSIIHHPFTKHILENHPFPKEISKIREGRILSPTANLEGEFAWFTYSIIQHSDILNKFIELRECYENCVFRNQLEEATAILGEIDSSVGVSIWGIEQRLILAELKGGTENNWLEQSRISQECRDELLLLLVENFSRKSESKISFQRFRDLFLNQISPLENTLLFEYLCFRLIYFNSTGYNNYGFYLAAESNSPLIDRYLILLDVVCEILITSKQQGSLIPEFLFELINDCQGKINDHRLNSIRSIIDPQNVKIQENTSQLITLLNYYYEGDFSKCAVESIKLIEQHPRAIEYYELYVKSIIECKCTPNTDQLPEIPRQVIGNLFHLLIRDDGASQANQEIMKICSVFSSFSAGKQLFGLFQHSTKFFDGSEKKSLILSLNSQFINPMLYEFLDAEQSRLLTNAYKEKNLYGLGVQTALGLGSANYNWLENSNISERRKTLYQIRVLMKLKDYSNAVEKIEGFILNNLYSDYVKEELLVRLFECYIELSSFQEAISLYVDNYLKNRNFLLRFNTELLVSKIQASAPIDITRHIDTPIFFRLCTNDLYNQYVAYDNYLCSFNFRKPTEILREIQGVVDDKKVLFLRHVCTPEVLNYSINFDGIEEIENERIVILGFLILNDPTNESGYIKEITELKQRTNIRKAIQVVNKGRITININQLKVSYGTEFAEVFNRFKELSLFAKKENLVGYDLTGKRIKEYINQLVIDKRQEVSELKKDPAFISFKVMFLELRDRFLFSKEFGLEGYLSTRIRHGSLENHIRSVFENNNLVSEKNKEGKYSDLDIVSRYTNYGLLSYYYQLQEELKAFSDRIDTTIQFIVNELIQIYTEKINSKPSSKFNYNLTDDYLWIVYQNYLDSAFEFDQFLDFAFKELESVTELLLDDLKKMFQEDLKEKFLGHLDILEDRIKNRLGVTNFTEFNTSVNKCRTEIQTEFDKISEWFELSNTRTDLTLGIETIIKTAVEISNSIYPNFQLYPRYVSLLDIPLFGTVHLVYILRILLDNIIKHSGQESSTVEIIINSEFHDDLLRLIFTNTLGDGVDKDSLQEKLRNTSENWNKSRIPDNINFEGGSGFDKIKRILSYDMRCPTHNFNFKLDDQNQLSIILDMNVLVYEQ